jgi:periplasmic protein CpxP/Spy
MRILSIRTGFLALLMFVAAVSASYAQTSGTGGASPQAAPPSQSTPSQSSPDQQPAAAPSQSTSPQTAPDQQPAAAPSQSPQQEQPPQASPSQSAPAQSAPSQSGQSGSASQSSQGADDNPLCLTEEQKTKLRPIISDENQQMEAVRNDSSLSAEQKVAKANQIRETASPKIRAVLTPEQLQKLAELQKARQQQGGSSQQSAPSSGSQKPQ